MNKQEIIDAYCFLREHNHDISDATLNFMKDVSLRELEKIENGEPCLTCRFHGQQMVFPGQCTGCGVDGDHKNFQVKI